MVRQTAEKQSGTDGSTTVGPKNGVPRELTLKPQIPYQCHVLVLRADRPVSSCVACRLVLCLVNGIISEQAHLLATLGYSGAAGALDFTGFVLLFA